MIVSGWLPQGAEAWGQDIVILAAIVTAVGVLARQAWKVAKFFQRMAEHIEAVPKLEQRLEVLAQERRDDIEKVHAEIARLRQENSDQHAEARAEYGARFDAIEAYITKPPTRKRTA